MDAGPRRSASIPELDGLRGLAILLVLGRHAVRPFWSPEQPLLPLGGWDAALPLLNGWMGVDLFFVLSGFLIAHHLQERRLGAPGGVSLGDYARRRFLRIAPAYYAVLVIAALGVVPGFQPAREGLGVRLLYHVLFLQDYLPADIVVAFWSLGVEIKFYLLAPFLLLALRRLAPSRQYAALAALWAVPLLLRLLTRFGHGQVAGYAEFFAVFRSPFHLCADGLLVGVLCALLYRDRERLAWMRRSGVCQAIFWSGAVAVAALLAATPLLAEIDLVDTTILSSAVSLGMGGLLLGLVLGAGPRGFFRGRLLAFLARISYSLYLVHLPLVPALMALCAVTFGWQELSPGLRFLSFLPPFALASTAAAIALHRTVERPFLELSRRGGLRARAIRVQPTA